MSKPLVVSIPHKLGKAEAMRRVREGLGTTRGKFVHLLTVEREDWSGDHVAFQVHAMAQTARACSPKPRPCPRPGAWTSICLPPPGVRRAAR